MSFAKDIKDELVKRQPASRCCAIAELYGILLLANDFDRRQIRLVSEYAPLPKRISRLLRLIDDKGFEPELIVVAAGGDKQVIVIGEEETVRGIMRLFDYDIEPEVTLHLHGWLLENDCCRASFLRGLFLTGGFAVDPEKKYQLELVIRRSVLSKEIEALLIDMGLSPRRTQRGGQNILAYKESESIEDFLTMTGAQNAALRLMEAKVVKDVRNKVNRKVNCETANLFKSIENSQRQLSAIKRLSELHGGLAFLPDGLREAAQLRLDNPELSLNELAALTGGRVSRSGLNYRLNKLVELAGTEADVK